VAASIFALGWKKIFTTETPVSDWLSKDLEDYVRQTLSPDRLSKHALFDVDRVIGLVDGLYHTARDHTYANKVLSLIVFQEWYELYMM